ncbi:putative pentatricopeptide repeat-containing protein At1g03510 [Aristolochia californica]|uniref:putative pentatricopeptide repeat-containing protein At1g03510 n=1 Tax=Aristolochia californica TaxID=171875 RepID=UPI0035DB6C5F
MSIHQQLLSFTKLLSSHIYQGRLQQALDVFHKILNSPSLSPDPFVLSLGLKALTLLNFSCTGSIVHARSHKTGLLSNPFVSSSLIHMYGKCVSIRSARQLFDETSNRNVVVWNTMISLHCVYNQIASGIQLFDLMDVPPTASTFNSIITALSGSQNFASRAVDFCRLMQLSGLRPNLITVVSLLPACVGDAAFDLVREIHGFSVRNHLYPHSHTSSALVEAYGRCGCLGNSYKVFSEIPEKDVVTWSTMVSACAVNGEAATALSVFSQMESTRIRPDGVAFLGVLKACSHAGLPDDAMYYFSRMRGHYGIDAGSDHYACLVDVLGRAGRLSEAYDVLRGMPMEATVSAWGALLSACRTYGDVELAEIAGEVLFEIEPDNAGNYVLLASIYSTAGRFKEAEQVRKAMKERGVKSLPGGSWLRAQET